MGFENSAGLGNRNHYGPRKVVDKFGGIYRSPDGIVTAEHIIVIGDEITGAPATSNVLLTAATNEMENLIPAFSVVESCTVDALVALSTTGGSAAATASIQVGLEQNDGTDIDLDGLMNALDGDLTIASNDVVEAIGWYAQGHGAALIRNFQYDGDTTGAAVDVTQTELVDIGTAAANLYVALVIDDITGMTAAAGTIRVRVTYRVPGN